MINYTKFSLRAAKNDSAQNDIQGIYREYWLGYVIKSTFIHRLFAWLHWLWWPLVPFPIIIIKNTMNRLTMNSNIPYTTNTPETLKASMNPGMATLSMAATNWLTLMDLSESSNIRLMMNTDSMLSFTGNRPTLRFLCQSPSTTRHHHRVTTSTVCQSSITSTIQCQVTRLFTLLLWPAIVIQHRIIIIIIITTLRLLHTTMRTLQDTTRSIWRRT